MTYFSIFIALVWAYLCYLFVSLLRNYYAAKAVGIPVIISPVDVFHPVWLVFGGLVKPFIFILPYGLRRWSTFYNLDWPFYDKGRIHRDVGEVFALVNPWNIAIILDDPVGAEAVYHRRKDFIKGGNYNLFNFFGKNVFSVNGEDWARQRRITGPCFNENVSGLVWDESTRQARAMLNLWTIGTDSVVNSMLDDTRMITLHVLSGVGFGVRQDFGHGMANVKAGHTLAYRDAIVGLLAHLGEVMVFPRKVLNFPILPKSMKDAGTLLNEFGTYMDEMLNDERQAIEKGEAASRKSNLLSAMIQSSAEERNPKARLTDEEIKGNLFIFNVAGHETTANTLAYAISLLALNQDCQTWLREELKQYTQGQEPRSYEEVFPRLKRCQAIMWETLRLYGPVLSAPRFSHGHQVLPLSGGKSISVPPDTAIHVNHYGIQTSPSLWSTDAFKSLDFCPQRWIYTSEMKLSEETLVHPQPGTFLAWSSGPRICLGMKFSQVEFVAVISTVFARHIVEPAVAREKLEAILAQTKPENPALSIPNSADVVFRLREVSMDGKQ